MSGQGKGPRQPPPSLLRSIFVTWLNSLPYADDREFLVELQQSAAEFQTHTLATANAVYDADVVSYERLLALTRVCERFAERVALADGGGQAWQKNLDSDDEHFEARLGGMLREAHQWASDALATAERRPVDIE